VQTVAKTTCPSTKNGDADEEANDERADETRATVKGREADAQSGEERKRIDG
jgi:hypothetical protein